MLNVVVRQAVVELTAIARIKTNRRSRAFRLQINHEIMLIGKRAYKVLVSRFQRFKNTQHEHRHLFTDGNFNLRHAVFDRKGADQLAQRHDEG